MKDSKEVIKKPSQKGFYLKADSFVRPHTKGSKMIKPPEKTPRKKRLKLEEMPVKQQWGVLTSMGFGKPRIKKIIYDGDKTPFRGEENKRVVAETEEGGLRIWDLRDNCWELSCVAEQGKAVGIFSIIPGDRITPSKIG